MRPTELKLKTFMNGVSQSRIARRADVSLAYVNQVINGKAKPSAKVRKAISELTGLTEEILFGGGDSKKAS